MHCGVMVTGYNQRDWERLLAEDYSRPPAVSDAANMDDTLALGELVEHEEYLKRQTADVGVAEAGLAARRATQPIGTPDEIIEKIRTLQHALSLEMGSTRRRWVGPEPERVPPSDHVPPISGRAPCAGPRPGTSTTGAGS